MFHNIPVKVINQLGQIEKNSLIDCNYMYIKDINQKKE
jgi:hypothetical protein